MAFMRALHLVVLAVSMLATPLQSLAQAPTLAPPAVAGSGVDIESRKLALEAQKLEDEKQRTRIQRDAEDRLARNEPAQWMKVVGIFGTPLSILVSIIVAVIGYRAQAKAMLAQQAAQTETLKAQQIAQTESLNAQLRLKAAEIAMDARSSSQIENKAKALAALFPKDLQGFGNEFDKNKFKLGQSVERRQALLELLASHPTERRQTLETWAVIFPWDANDWLRLVLESEGIAIPSKPA